MAYPPATGLGHLSFSADDVYLVLSGSARLLISLAQQCAAPPPSYLLILHHHLHHPSTAPPPLHDLPHHHTAIIGLHRR